MNTKKVMFIARYSENEGIFVLDFKKEEKLYLLISGSILKTNGNTKMNLKSTLEWVKAKSCRFWPEFGDHLDVDEIVRRMKERSINLDDLSELLFSEDILNKIEEKLSQSERNETT